MYYYYYDHYLNQIVLKKLGHNFELDQLDEFIVEEGSGGNVSANYNHVSRAVRPLTHKHLFNTFSQDAVGTSGKTVHHLKHFSSKSLSSTFPGSDILICPSQRKFAFLEERVFLKNLGVYRLTFLYNLMTVLLFNSEPIVFQAFPSEDGWPFPSFLGSCGRFVVEEYVGPSLAEWLPTVGWKQRINAALQLLLIAQQFDRGQSGFRLYLTDTSLYNIAVTPDNQLKIIDGENIILVDLDQIKLGTAARLTIVAYVIIAYIC